VHSKSPRRARMYEDYSMRCKLHQGCEFNPDLRKMIRHLGTVTYRSKS